LEEAVVMSKLKKIVKPRAIELDPDEPTIIVNYDTIVVDQAQQTPDGEPVVVTKKSSKKRYVAFALQLHCSTLQCIVL
jgi:hypothetical protein